MNLKEFRVKLTGSFPNSPNHLNQITQEIFQNFSKPELVLKCFVEVLNCFSLSRLVLHSNIQIFQILRLIILEIEKNSNSKNSSFNNSWVQVKRKIASVFIFSSPEKALTNNFTNILKKNSWNKNWQKEIKITKSRLMMELNNEMFNGLSSYAVSNKTKEQLSQPHQGICLKIQLTFNLQFIESNSLKNTKEIIKQEESISITNRKLPLALDTVVKPQYPTLLQKKSQIKFRNKQESSQLKNTQISCKWPEFKKCESFPGTKLTPTLKMDDSRNSFVNFKDQEINSSELIFQRYIEPHLSLINKFVFPKIQTLSAISKRNCPTCDTRLTSGILGVIL